MAAQQIRLRPLLRPDSANRLKLQVPARFATRPGLYRWRVWSVGVDGTIVLSDWRALNIAEG